jgi:DMSO reductase family type II enzyme heme b subunit
MRRSIAVVAGCALLFSGCGSGEPGGPAAPAQKPATSERAQKADPGRAKTLYETHCAPCHGIAGDGQGTAAYLLSPRPRDFTRSFRLVSTRDGVPTDEDLLRTLERGMPGSAMPSWAHLPEADRRALVALIKSFNPSRFEGEREPISVPPETAADEASIARGKALYATNCAPCHGPEGRGDGKQAQVDEEERPVRPRDLTRGIYKGGGTPRDTFLRVRAGMPGSPMPANNALSDAELWDVVHFVHSLAPAGGETRGVQVRRKIEAKRVENLPEGPADPAWARAGAAEIVLAPLSWREDRVESVAVSALHDGKKIAFRLAWKSPRAEGIDDFRDGAAIEIATTPEEPSFAMGQKGAPVEILQWRGENPKAARRAFDDAHALGLDFYAARDAQNPIADPAVSAVLLEDASGFGTLAVAPRTAQLASGAARYEGGGWQITIVRPLGKPDGRCADLVPGGARPVAFAIWQGAYGDRNGQKNFSMWHDLAIER